MRQVCRVKSLIYVVCSYVVQMAWGQVLFYADFEDNSADARPGPAVNQLASWKPENPAQIWAIGDCPATKSKGLKQTVEGCDKSGNTPLPGPVNFTDGNIQLEMTWGDDDSWGIVFRQTAKNKGYVVTFGANETPAVIVALLDKGCGEVGKCNDMTLCENNPANTLIQTPHGLGAFDQTNNTAYFGRIRAVGNRIQIWYLKRGDVKDPMGDLGNPLIDITDNTHSSGTVGIWHESMNNSFIDNVLVTGASGLSVDVNGRLAALWGSLKSR